MLFCFAGGQRFHSPASGWSVSPLNADNNINHTTCIRVKDYLTMENGNILGFQETYVRRLARELNRYDNVILNIAEDPWANNQDR